MEREPVPAARAKAEGEFDLYNLLDKLFEIYQ